MKSLKMCLSLALRNRIRRTYFTANQSDMRIGDHDIILPSLLSKWLQRKLALPIANVYCQINHFI